MAVYCDGEYGGCRVDGCNVDGCGVDGCSCDVQSQYPVFVATRGLAFLVSLRPLRGKPPAPQLGDLRARRASMPDGSEKSSFVAAGHVRINRYAKPVFIPCFYGLGKLRVVHFEVRFRVMVLCACRTPV
jgi:hypothetical protein